MIKNHVLQDKKRETGRHMIRMGARAGTVAALLNLPQPVARRLYVEVTGKSSPSGQMPDSHEFYFTPVNRVHASILLMLYRTALADGLDRAHALTAAYERYLRACASEPEITFDRAWRLVTLSASRNYIGEAHCTKCKKKYIVQPHEIKSSFICPVCQGRLDTSTRLRNAFRNRSQDPHGTTH